MSIQIDERIRPVSGTGRLDAANGPIRDLVHDERLIRDPVEHRPRFNEITQVLKLARSGQFQRFLPGHLGRPARHVAAAALGGFDSIAGAVVGGLLVGLIETFVPAFFTAIGNELSLVMVLAVIMIILYFRPQGLFGSKRVERV